jgi:cation diffusion facilitator family transporter
VPLLAFVRQSKDPTVKAVLSEDTTDLLGLTIAAAGITLTWVTGADAWDAGAAILVGCLLVYVALALGSDTKGLLLGEAAPQRERAALREAIAAHDGIAAVVDLRTMYVGPQSLLVAARVDLRDGLPAERVEQLAAEIDRDLRERVPAVDQVFLDPTGRRD